MALWTDIIDPATLTGYARASLADYEASKGTLARWLPNRLIEDIVARFVAGETGLVDIADFRAFDAEPTIGKAPGGKRVTLELPAIGRNIPVSEYNQLRARGSASDDAIRNTILRTTDSIVRAVSDAIEKVRGTVLVTGKATVAGFMDDDFGRAAGHTVNAAAVWTSATNLDVLGEIGSWQDTYLAANGVKPGSMVISTAIARAMAKQTQFATQLGNGASRPASFGDISDTLVANDLPPIYVYDRLVSVGGVATRVVAADKLLLLPAAVESNDWQGTELGATFWGRTLSSTEADWAIEDTEQPGLVAGVYRHETPPMIAEVHSDAIAMPVLANANLSFAADVLT